MQPPDRFELTQEDKNSLLWKRLKEFYEQENDKDRKRNDDLSLTEDETRNIRAMIAARKSLLKLDL